MHIIMKKHVRHGKRYTKLYNTWRAIKTRCYNKNQSSYKNYGGRGITMQGDWIDDFLKFEFYVKSLASYNESLTLDRINNNKSYVEGNLRWANRTIQSRNRRMHKKNKTGFVGVFYEKEKKLYRAYVTVDYKQIKLGRRKTAKEAYQLRVDYIIANKLEGFEIKLP